MYLFTEYINSFVYYIQYTRVIYMDGFKPVKNEKTVISIRIDKEMLYSIDVIANKIDISRNEMIIQCIDYALKNFKVKIN